jgi:hypothetical protein
MTYIIYYIILYYQIKPIAVFCLFTNYCSRPGRQGLSEYHAAPSFFGRKEDLNCLTMTCRSRNIVAQLCVKSASPAPVAAMLKSKEKNSKNYKDHLIFKLYT